MQSSLEKYHYLRSMQYVDIWVNGGTIPLKLASQYRSQEQKGNKTPDEAVICDLNVDPKPMGIDIEVENCGGFIFEKGTAQLPDGQKLYGKHFFEDGYILCFSKAKSDLIRDGLEAAACVAIREFGKLKAELDRQVGAESIEGECYYTKTHKRGPFLKGKEAGFMQEYRLYWKIKPRNDVLWVNIPRGTGVHVVGISEATS